ncbi:YpiF family protein [Jeotgalibacillus soli]|uniref:DUF2487 domain-containing protein n=1 Tax=Jeotgalibacillus soli TaxID=889306 RepID=A0A0C2V599_9BACL|nr:YpiF family protein [Jeotgalibacillus soli]KIL44192.1 hypothetical protein KP78_31560 [Jeotgalibacillus soli]
MLWNSQEVEVFLKERDYIDTAIVPLLPVSLDKEMKQAASQGEFMSMLTVVLEKQFKGRMMLLPAYTYMNVEEGEENQLRLQKWTNELKAQGFKHVFCLTSDSSWKEREQNINAEVIWLPTVPLEHMDEPYKRTIIEDQVKQLVTTIVQKWQIV